MSFMDLEKSKVVAKLNEILEYELAGVVRYTHYSLMLFGYTRLPLVTMMKTQANESLLHAQQAGEYITTMGGHPSLKIGALLETHKHDIESILKESLEHERAHLQAYEQLLELVKDKSVMLEEYARTMIADEETHIAEMDKMLRSPGDITPFHH